MDDASQWRWSGRERLFVCLQAAVLTCVSIFGPNGYHYGVWDHSIVVPFVKHVVNGDLYPGDYLFSAERYYYTFLWKGLGLLARSVHANLPALFFACYVAALVATFCAFHLIVLTLFGRREVATLACCLLVFSRETLADAATLERIFLTRTAALPLVLFSLYLFLKRRDYAAFALLGCAFLVHPLTAVYAACMLGLAALARVREMGLRRLVACCVLAAAIASPILVWEASNGPSPLGHVRADPGWVRLLALRSSHHLFPFSWTGRRYLEAGLVAVLFAALLAAGPSSRQGRVVKGFVLAVALLCALGVIGSQVVPTTAVLVLQPLRSFQFIVYLAIAYYAAFLCASIDDAGKRWRLVVAGLCSFALLLGAHGWRAAAPTCLAGSILIAVGGARVRERLSSGSLSLMFAGALVAVGLACSHGSGPLTVGNGQGHDWLDVQRWARENTGRDAAFIVPPRVEGFRVESERPIYADWKDGTLTNFDPAFGVEWHRRMERLGAGAKNPREDSFTRLGEGEITAIAREDLATAPRVFLVSLDEGPRVHFPLRYRNSTFLVYEVPTRSTVADSGAGR